MTRFLEDFHSRLGEDFSQTQDEARAAFRKQVFNKIDELKIESWIEKQENMNRDFANMVNERFRDFEEPVQDLFDGTYDVLYKVITSYLYNESFKHFLIALEFLAKRIAIEHKHVLDIFLGEISPYHSEKIGLFWDAKEKKFYRVGAQELDKPLIQETLIWLKEFPEAERNFRHALKTFSDLEGEDQKILENILSDLRKAWESLVNVLSKKKKGKGLIQKIMGTSKEDEWDKLFKDNNDFIHNFRHGKESSTPISKHDAEYFMYFVGMTLRWIIQRNR